MFGNITPNKFDEFILHQPIVEKLKSYDKESMLNYIFYGKVSCGKRTIINSFIKYLYNIDDDIGTNLVEYNIKINNNDVKIQCLQSNYHYEINLYEYGLYDKHVLCEFVKEIASTRNVYDNSLKLIFLNSFDNVSKYAQLALRRMLEQLSNSARFIISANTLSKLDSTLISRCSLIRVPFPNDIELNQYLDNVSSKLNLSFDSDKKKTIIKKSKGDIFKLNLLIFNNNYIDPITVFVKEIEHIIEKDKNILFIDKIRVVIYKMHLLDFKPADIITEYINHIAKSKKYTDNQLCEIVQEGALNEYKTNLTNKYFFCLEKFFIFIRSIKD